MVCICIEGLQGIKERHSLGAPLPTPSFFWEWERSAHSQLNLGSGECKLHSHWSLALTLLKIDYKLNFYSQKLTFRQIMMLFLWVKTKYFVFLVMITAILWIILSNCNLGHFFDQFLRGFSSIFMHLTISMERGVQSAHSCTPNFFKEWGWECALLN